LGTGLEDFYLMPDYFKPFKLLWKFLVFGLVIFFLPDAYSWVVNNLNHSDLLPADSIKLLFQAIGGAFVGAVALLYIVQLPAYQEDITRFFRTAFTDPQFISQLDDSIKMKIFQTALLARYERQCDPELLEEFSAILTHTEDPYYLKLETSTLVKIVGDTTTREVRRCIHIKNNRTKSAPLLDFLNESTSRNVYLHRAADKRVIHDVQLSVGSFRKKVLIPPSHKVDNQVTDSQPDEVNYSSKSTVDWKKLGDLPGHSDLKDQVVQPGEVVEFIYNEVITTGLDDVEVAFRLRYFCKGIRAEVRLDSSDGKKRKLKGTLLGNLPDRTSFDIRDSQGKLVCETERWLVPGSGYHIYFYVDA
jgi:hypothetical protein